MQTTIPYSTSEIDLISYLIALGAKVIGVDADQVDERTKVFLFQLTEEQSNAIPHYYDGTKQLSALVLMNARKTAYRLLSDGQRKNR